MSFMASASRRIASAALGNGTAGPRSPIGEVTPLLKGSTARTQKLTCGGDFTESVESQGLVLENAQQEGG